MNPRTSVSPLLCLLLISLVFMSVGQGGEDGDVPWAFQLQGGGGEFWRERQRIDFPLKKARLGAPASIAIGNEPGTLALAGTTAESIRVVSAQGIEQLFLLQTPDGQSLTRGAIPEGSILTLPVTGEEGDTASYYVYSGNPAAWELPDRLAVPAAFTNGGFEGGSETSVKGWEIKDTDAAHRAGWSKENPRGGTRCAVIEVDAGAEPSWVGHAASVPVASSTAYLFQGWLRAENLDGNAGWFFHALDRKGELIKVIPTDCAIRPKDGSSWTEVNARIELPENASMLRIGTFLRGTGSAWFDDASLVPEDETDMPAVAVHPKEALDLAVIGKDAPWPTRIASVRRIPIRVLNLQSVDAKTAVVCNLSAILRGEYANDKYTLLDGDRELPVYAMGSQLLVSCTLPPRCEKYLYLYLTPTETERELSLSQRAARLPQSGDESAQGSSILSDQVVVSTRSLRPSAEYAKLLNDPSNLARNGSFEEGTPLPAEWPVGAERELPAGASYDEDGSVAAFGAKSARIRVPAEANPDWIGWRQSVAVKPGRHYLYAGWVKTENMTDNLKLHAHLRDGADNLLATGSSTGAAVGTNDWTLLSDMFLTPPDTANFQIHLTFLGTGTVWHDGIVLMEATPSQPGAMQERPSDDRKALRLWPVNPVVKVFPQDLPPRTEQPAVIRAARNEPEPLQLAIRSDRPMGGLQIRCNPPRHATGATLDNIRINIVGYVPVDAPTSYYRTKVQEWERKLPNSSPNSDGWEGFWPDPLLPQSELKLEAGRTQPVWATFTVPENAAAGDYTGTVELTDGKTTVAAFPFTVHVFGFTIPAKNKVHAIYDYRPTPMHLWLRPGQTRDDLREETFKMMAQYRLAPDRIEASPVFTLENGAVKADFTEYDRAAAAYFDEMGFGVSYTPPAFYCFGWAHPPKKFLGQEPYLDFEYESTDRRQLNPAYKQAYQQALRLYWDHMKEKGWDKKLVLYISDEPHYTHEVVREQMKALCAMIHEVSPDIPIYSSTWRHCADWNESLDIWGVGHYGGFPVDAMAERKKAGKRVWFTTDGQMCTDTPYCAVERLLPLYCFKYNADAYEFWGINWLTYNPFEYGWHSFIRQADKPGQYYYTRYPNGDGFLIYPGGPIGVEGLVSSIRLEQAREGMEDHAYLTLLQELIAQGKAKGKDVSGAEAALADVLKIVTIPNAGGRYATRVLPDPEIIPVAKAEIGAWIERLGRE